MDKSINQSANGPNIFPYCWHLLSSPKPFILSLHRCQQPYLLLLPKLAMPTHHQDPGFLPTASHDR